MAIKGCGEITGVQELIEVVKSEQGNEIIHVDRIIEQFQLLDREKAAGTLTDILQNESDSYLRRVAALALGEIGDERAIVPLMCSLETSSDEILRMNAVSSLGLINDKIIV